LRAVKTRIPLAVLIALLALAATRCSNESPKPLSVAGEKLYVLHGVILSRNDAANTLSVDHEAISGFMEAMVMDYSVRGAAVSALPKDKARIEAKLHVTDTAYWLTDVKARP
jgi:protein SCO1